MEYNHEISLDTIIEAVSIIGAVVSFIIVQSIEKKKERKLANREIYQQLEFASIDLFRFEAENIEMIRPIWEEGKELPDEDTADYTVLMNYVCQMLNLFEMAMKFRRDKVFQAEVFGTWVAWFELLVGAPGFPAIWENVRLDYLPELREIMDGGIIIAQNEEDDDVMEHKFYSFVSDVIGCQLVSEVADSREYTERVEMLRKNYQQSRPETQQIEAGKLEIQWLENEGTAKELADFFIRNSQNNYISHSEIQEGRAVNETLWSDKLPEVLATEFLSAVKTDRYTDLDIVVAYYIQELAGFALVEYEDSPNGRYALLSDIVVEEKYRNNKIGEILFNWLLPLLKEQGMKQVFAESNLHNDPAHAFLEKVGFKEISKVFRMEI